MESSGILAGFQEKILIETPDLSDMRTDSDIKANENEAHAIEEANAHDTEQDSPRHEKEAKPVKTSELETLMNSILDNPEKFYQYNNITKLPKFSPFSKMKVHKIEKRLEGTELILQKWAKSLKQVNKSCEGYYKSIEAFVNQLLLDKNHFGENKELQYLISLVAHFLKEKATYSEVFTKIITNSIIK